MAATKRNAMRIPEVREKIRATQLVKRLESHVLDGVDMNATQVTAALGLLKKCLPDMKESQLSGPDGGPIRVEKIERVVVDPKA